MHFRISAEGHHKRAFQGSKLLTLVLGIVVAGGFALVGPASADVDAGLVLHLPFDCDALDISPYQNDGIEYGDPACVEGVYGQAISLDGVDDYVLVPDSDSLDLTTAGTLALWVKLPNGAQLPHRALISKMQDSTSNLSYVIYLGYSPTPGDPSVVGQAVSGTPTGLAYSLGRIDDGIWRHIVFTWDASTGDTIATIYVDGSNATDLATEGVGDCRVGPWPLYIGRFLYDPHNTWYHQQAVIDDVRIYERALLETEIAELSDGDGDGVLDPEDQCMGTTPGDPVDVSGCSIADLCPCEQPNGGDQWKNHGAYVSCVAHTAKDFVALELITQSEKGAIVSAAAKSSCGHRNK